MEVPSRKTQQETRAAQQRKGGEERVSQEKGSHPQAWELPQLLTPPRVDSESTPEAVPHAESKEHPLRPIPQTLLEKTYKKENKSYHQVPGSPTPGTISLTDPSELGTSTHIFLGPSTATWAWQRLTTPHRPFLRGPVHSETLND